MDQMDQFPLLTSNNVLHLKAATAEVSFSFDCV